MILPRQGSFRELGPTLEPLGQAPIGSQSCLQQLYVATGGRPLVPHRAGITRPHSSLPLSTRRAGVLVALGDALRGGVAPYQAPRDGLGPFQHAA